MKKAAKWLLCINLLAWTLLAVQVLTVNMEQRVAQNTVPVQNGDVQAKGEDADAVKKKVALTFDDGPDPDYTEMLLDGLKKRNVKATFFLLGKQAEAYPDIVKRMHKEGHMIGNHSYDHVNLANLSKTDAAKQIRMTSEAIHKITGEYPQYLRPPFGNGATGMQLCEEYDDRALGRGPARLVLRKFVYRHRKSSKSGGGR